MKSNSSLKYEQEKLQQKYASYLGDEMDESSNSSYWSFFKLRILFSIILLLFVFGSTKATPSKETRQIKTVMQYMNKQDPYTKKMILKLKKATSTW